MRDTTVTDLVNPLNPVGRIIRRRTESPKDSALCYLEYTPWHETETPDLDEEVLNSLKAFYTSIMPSLLHRIVIQGQSTPATSSPEEDPTSNQITGLRYFLRPCLTAQRSLRQATITLEEELVVRYKQFDQVHSIYLLETPDLVEITIFLDQPRYNKQLMHSLFDEEAELIQGYRSKLLDFHYFPLFEENDLLPVSPKARLIWSKS